MTASLIYEDNTSVIKLNGLADSAGAFQNDATVTLQTLVLESDSTAVTGISLPLTMSYVAASDGNYTGTIPFNTTMVSGNSYIGTVLAIASGGERAQWEERLKVKTRKG